MKYYENAYIQFYRHLEEQLPDVDMKDFHYKMVKLNQENIIIDLYNNPSNFFLCSEPIILPTDKYIIPYTDMSAILTSDFIYVHVKNRKKLMGCCHVYKPKEHPEYYRKSTSQYIKGMVINIDAIFEKIARDNRDSNLNIILNDI